MRQLLKSKRFEKIFVARLCLQGCFRKFPRKGVDAGDLLCLIGRWKEQAQGVRKPSRNGKSTVTSVRSALLKKINSCNSLFEKSSFSRQFEGF